MPAVESHIAPGRKRRVVLLPISAATARQVLTLSDAHIDGSTAAVAAIDRGIRNGTKSSGALQSAGGAI
jgi:hypothetical protein